MNKGFRILAIIKYYLTNAVLNWCLQFIHNQFYTFLLSHSLSVSAFLYVYQYMSASHAAITMVHVESFHRTYTDMCVHWPKTWLGFHISFCNLTDEPTSLARPNTSSDTTTRNSLSL